jgi:chemotaxis protein methyltransferase CheR
MHKKRQMASGTMLNSSEHDRQGGAGHEDLPARGFRRTVATAAGILKDKEFKRLSELVGREAGIKLPPQKKVMLESRLQRRIKALGMGSCQEYCDYVFSPEGQAEELLHLIDVVTTNTTEFFREPQHFVFLARNVLPLWSDRQKGQRTFSCWSAGCSTGEEPYTLAMALSDEFQGSPHDFRVLASDISPTVLAKASTGIYPEERLRGVSPEQKKRYILRSKDRDKRLVRIAPELRGKVHFFHLNFMDGVWPLKDQMDAIFCRNVLIYFERPTQQAIVARLCNHLKPGGFLFIGHSESLAGMDLPLRHVAPTIYQRPRA